jgi:DNA-binding transcriptional ArsR family regulator
MASEDRPEIPRITDARRLRALAHPVRIALLEELSIYGPMTATQVGERIGETPTTCSFHLRQLAKYGFVEEAGGGKGRARPWRVTSVHMSIDGDDGDAETQIAAGTLLRLFRERTFARAARWQETRAAFPREWRDAANNSEFVSYLTPAELKKLNEDMFALLYPWTERLTDPSKRPPGALPVETLMLSYPIAPPEASEPEAGSSEAASPESGGSA